MDMTDEINALDEQGLVDAAAKVQKLMMEVAPNPGDGLGVTAMMMTNFLATGLVCGILDEGFIDKMMVSIREAVNESVAAIHEGIAADAVTETIQ
jgi:hypothetical protein